MTIDELKVENEKREKKLFSLIKVAVDSFLKGHGYDMGMPVAGDVIDFIDRQFKSHNSWLMNEEKKCG